MAAEKHSIPTTTFNSIRREGRSEKLVAEVEPVFGEDAGVLFGIKLVGIYGHSSAGSYDAGEARVVQPPPRSLGPAPFTPERSKSRRPQG